jgi:2-polyprenyl-6-methoxyphenol hydroxylase-like FAD-dependent oxidoreductase
MSFATSEEVIYEAMDRIKTVLILKAVILGGIAGLTMGLLLRKENWDVVISEISKYGQPRTCILMSADGLSILSEFSKEQSSALHKQNVYFSLKKDRDEETESN